MKTNVVWKAVDETGLEFLEVIESESAIEANGTIIKIENGKPFRAVYSVSCDTDWTVREVKIDVRGETERIVRLRTDGAGKWTDAENNSVSALDGCLYIDVSATPFTNTLPIRRLRLQKDESAQIAVVYFLLPDLTVKITKQRYTCLEKSDDAAVYRFEEMGVFAGFAAEITVDERGFVVEYPNLFERINVL